MRNKISFIVNYIFTRLKLFLGFNKFYFLDRKAIEVDNLEELNRVFGWNESPILDRDDIDVYEFIEDVNSRRRRDAEAIATVVRNINPKVALEIGTADGGGTALISVNVKNGTVYTVNISPEDIDKGQGGIFITKKFELDEIGEIYKKKGLKNVKQIFANTETWDPDIGIIDVAFIDGCHDTRFVIGDTIKIISNMRKGSYILWHDFNPNFTKRHDWISDVCLGVERLFRKGYLKNNVYYIKNSWVGIYKI